MNALVAKTTCRDRAKIPCDDGTGAAGWCYISVHELTASPTSLRSPTNRILAADYGDAESRVWITEGPRIAENPNYLDTVEIVFESGHNVNGPYPPFDLSVCCFSATLVSGIGSTTGNHTTPNSITYLPHVTLANGTTTLPRQLLVMLVLHAVTALAGSVWKVLTRRRVVLGWMDTSDYTMLGADSEELEEAVGIKGARECGCAPAEGYRTPEAGVSGEGLCGWD